MVQATIPQMNKTPFLMNGGMVNPAWVRFFYDLWQRTGGSVDEPGTTEERTAILEILASVQDDTLTANIEGSGDFGGDSISGALMYYNGTYKQYYNAVNLHWDFANTRLGVGNTTPATTLDVSGATTFRELSVDPLNPSEGRSVLWMSDGTSLGDDGDVLIKTTAGGSTERTALNFKDFVPSSLTLNTGTGTGTVAGVQEMLDGSTYNIAEAAATPGFDVEFNFTNVDRNPRFLVARWQYNGSATHFVNIDIFNYQTVNWDTIHTFSDSSLHFVNATKYIPVNIGSDYVDVNGDASVRFYHITAGNALHDIDIDYVGLTHCLQGVI